MQLSEKTKNKLKGVMPVTKEEREDALASACMQVKRVLPEFTTKFQNAYSENGFYRPIDNVEWTTGFWTGEIWLAYEYGGQLLYCQNPKNHISQKKSMFAQLYYPLPNIPLQPNKHQAYYKPQELSVEVFSYQSYTNSNNYIDP